MNIKPCPICGEEMSLNEIHLCGGLSTLIHTCVNGIEIKIRGMTKYDVVRDWNTFVAIVNK